MISLKQQTILTLLSIIRERQLSHDSLNWRNQWYDTYDYVVVGAGTAGSVVAARLAEDVTINVLLIEAGGPQNMNSDIPALQGAVIGTDLDWDYPIVPQKYAYFGYIGNQKNISRGRAFGGCSMHNDMNYYLENPEYYDFWTKLTGVKNWTYYDVLPYFRKAENNLDHLLVKKYPDVHATGGPITVTTALPDPLLKAYTGAAHYMGYPITYTDGRKPFGTTIMQRNIKDGVRQTTSLVFLEQNPKKNLHILGQTFVTKVLFNERKRAIGVQFYRSNKFYNVFVRKEVIVCLGTIGSPKLLLLSGVGPKEHLQEIGVPLISNLRVGDNLLHTPAVALNFDIKDQSLIEKPIETFVNYYNYFIEKSGPLAQKVSGITHFPQVHYPGHPYLSNGELLPRIGYLGTDLEKLVNHFKLKDEWREYYRPYLNRTYFSFYPGLKKPQSVGTIRLRSKNPFHYPIIDPCVFCSQRDLSDSVKTFKLSLDIYLSPLMTPFIEMYKKPIPGCNPCPNDYYCDSYIRCIFQTFTDDTYPLGGSRIGIATDREAVVDQRLRVFGVSGLRVIDSSIIPVSTDQSTAITIMIGEYGSQMIKEDDHI